MLNNFASLKKKLTCRGKVGDTLISFDYGHLTVEGSKFVAENYILPAINLPTP